LSGKVLRLGGRAGYLLRCNSTPIITRAPPSSCRPLSVSCSNQNPSSAVATGSKVLMMAVRDAPIAQADRGHKHQ
jgi:hypothetical protein